jgi:hypothetical protein
MVVKHRDVGNAEENPLMIMTMFLSESVDESELLRKRLSLQQFHINGNEREAMEALDIVNSFDMDYYHQTRQKRFQSPIAPPNPYLKPLLADTCLENLMA